MPVEINGSHSSITKVPSPGVDSTNFRQGNQTTDNRATSYSTAESPMMNASVSANNSPSDPNDITVTIADHETPIVVLYGPQSCGKTMTLVRLTRYLKDSGYQVVPDNSFRDSQDEGYKSLCDNFDNVISSNNAAQSTSNINFMLVKILTSYGHPLCQILEAPGEHYYMPGVSSYPPYVRSIMNSRNRKIWAVMIEPKWENSAIRRDYVNNIRNLSKIIRHKGKVLFIYNKVDKSNAETSEDTIKEVKDLYPGIFEPFKNQNPISRFWKTYNCDLVRFETGSYNELIGGGMHYTQSDDEYPKALWMKIMKMIKG